MDIQELVDRLEELVEEGRSLPFIRGILIDDDRLLDLIDQMRISIPEEVRKAQQLLSQKDRIIAQAQERARRIVQQAEAERARMVEEHALVQAAQERAEEIVAQAQEEAARIRREAEEFVLRLFRDAEGHLEKALHHIRAGLQVMETTASETASTPMDGEDEAP